MDSRAVVRSSGTRSSLRPVSTIPQALNWFEIPEQFSFYRLTHTVNIALGSVYSDSHQLAPVVLVRWQLPAWHRDECRYRVRGVDK